ncbi:39S ribosomal protein L39, mitochondrial [Chelonus insularis]|uniref:39S ribosomal protein L39, mitochondrial n=1 Tax=Chelonus insularis TaxID=460826 RepID=UPI00158C16D9|nr:39S ribosomal protein L39, mitochondrial [Chelonus insularis]
MQGYKSLVTITFKYNNPIYSRCISSLSKSEAKANRNELFEKEKSRQRSSIGRVEKINVTYQNYEDEIIMLMNKNLSTPHDCAKHISEGVAKFSALASVDDTTWDLHKPLTSDCRLQLYTMKTPANRAVNNAFWRTCSFMLGAVIDSAFKDNVTCHLHSFPVPNVKSGSFTHDAFVELEDWKPTAAELKVLSAEFAKLINDELPVERLEVDENLALEMFKDNPFKTIQIPQIAKNNENKITLYKIRDHIDISRGPMVGNTFLMGRCTISAVHKVQTDAGENLYRFQGIALPKGIMVNHFIYSMLEERSKKLNQNTWMPQRIEADVEEKMAIASN